jgi:hypothetical protein
MYKDSNVRIAADILISQLGSNENYVAAKEIAEMFQIIYEQVKKAQLT